MICTLTHLEVSVAALILKNVAFDSLATAFALKKERPIIMNQSTPWHQD